MEKDLLYKCKWQKKNGIVVLISDKVDFKANSITKDKEGHYTMIEGSVKE